MDTKPSFILPAEYVGEASHDTNGVLTIGTGENPVEIRLLKGDTPGWWNTGTVSVYVRRDSVDLSVIEIHIARHDGLAGEADAEQDHQAELYPAGPKEYWRGEMVGKFTYGLDRHPMTDAEFEADWDEQ